MKKTKELQILNTKTVNLSYINSNLERYLILTNYFKRFNNKDTRNFDEYEFIPTMGEYLNEVREFIQLNLDLNNLPKYSNIVDIGGGLGFTLEFLRKSIHFNKLLSVEKYIPIKPDYLFKNSQFDLNIYESDMWDYLNLKKTDKTKNIHISNFNIIYLYNPLKNSDNMVKYLKLLISKMSKNSIIIFASSIDTNLITDLGFIKFSKNYQLYYFKK